MVNKKALLISLLLMTSILLSGCISPDNSDPASQDADEPDSSKLDESDSNPKDDREGDDSIDDNDDPIEDEDPVVIPDQGQKVKKFYYNTSGYCYNPDYPETGPSSDVRIFNWEELTGDRIAKQLFINYTLDAEDDHYGSFSEEDTGDVFILTDVLFNKSTGEEHSRDGIATLPGVCSADMQIHLQNITGGVGLLPIFQFEINITNCGEYPVYWKLGYFSEPDPGNEWSLLIEYSYIPEY